MKRYLVTLIVLCGFLMVGTPAQAVLIGPGTDSPLTGNQTSQAEIDGVIAGVLGSAVEVYKQNVGGSESGSLEGSYETTFDNDPLDPQDALIVYTGGDFVSAPAFLLVKDGNQEPAWYLFSLSVDPINWNGTDDLELQGFWPNEGAISHVALYGGTTRVSEPGTLLLLGSGLVGVAFLRRRFKA